MTPTATVSLCPSGERALVFAIRIEDSRATGLDVASELHDDLRGYVLCLACPMQPSSCHRYRVKWLHRPRRGHNLFRVNNHAVDQVVLPAFQEQEPPRRGNTFRIGAKDEKIVIFPYKWLTS